MVPELSAMLTEATRVIKDLRSRLDDAEKRVAETAALEQRVDAVQAALELEIVRVDEVQAELREERRLRFLAEAARNEALSRLGSRRRYPLH